MFDDLCRIKFLGFLLLIFVLLKFCWCGMGHQSVYTPARTDARCACGAKLMRQPGTEPNEPKETGLTEIPMIIQDGGQNRTNGAESVKSKSGRAAQTTATVVLF